MSFEPKHFRYFYNSIRKYGKKYPHEVHFQVYGEEKPYSKSLYFELVTWCENNCHNQFYVPIEATHEYKFHIQFADKKDSDTFMIFFMLKEGLGGV